MNFRQLLREYYPYPGDKELEFVHIVPGAYKCLTT